MPKKRERKENVIAESARALSFVRSEKFTSVYANFARINFTAFEVSMLFGHGGVNPEQHDKVVVEMSARVTLSIIEAKLLLQMLTTTISNFEDKYGTVAIPDDVKLPTDEHVSSVS